MFTAFGTRMHSSVIEYSPTAAAAAAATPTLDVRFIASRAAPAIATAATTVRI